MPPKPVLKGRAWGTRYDTLTPTTPTSPPLQDPMPTSNPSSSTTSVVASASSTASVNTAGDSVANPVIAGQADKLPHDASIFVGSLPTHVDQSELTRLLSEHLSPYTEVKTVKVVRDNKGGIFLNILYNDEARNHNTTIDQSSISSIQEIGPDALAGAGVLIELSAFNAETMQTFASAFGTVERFAEYSPDNDELNVTGETPGGDASRPPPHDAPRSVNMDWGVWEVKWARRDDCVNALMTLRRVPFLSVSWAHHANNPLAGGYSSHHQSPVSPAFGRFAPYSRTRLQSHPSVSSNGDEAEESGIQALMQRSREFTVPTERRTTSTAMYDDFEPSHQAWNFSHSTPFIGGPSSPFHSRSPGSRVVKSHFRSPKWSLGDSPPLHLIRAEGYVGTLSEDGNRSWGDREIREDGAGVVLGDQTATKSQIGISPTKARLDASSHSQLEGDASQSRSLPASPLMSQFAQTGRTNSIPPTPGFVVSPITPLSPKTVRNYPDTPTSAESRIGEEPDLQTSAHYSAPKYVRGSGGKYEPSWSVNVEKEFDPNTIFVGGLDMYTSDTWDEGQLRAIFERYGQIENIQFVRPMNKKSAFAFIRYSDIAAAARAVSEEHNQIYHNRHIRVQLRENNPQRTPWRPGRGRSRLPSSSLPHTRNAFVEGPDFRSRGDATGPLDPETKSQSMLSGRALYVRTAAGNDHTLLPARFSSFSLTKGDDMAAKTDSFTDAPESNLSSLSSSTTKVSLSRAPEAPYDQSTGTSTSMTPPPSVSSVGPSVSVAGAVQPYAMQNVGYFAPQPWMHAYPPHYPYPLPYLPHYAPGYPPRVVTRGPQQMIPGSGTSTAQGGTPTSWNGLNNPSKSVMPYVGYPAVMPAPDHEQQHSQVAQGGVQPPLRATGFIQGEHGMLIPVYQPEALHQYMSNAEHAQTPPPNVPVQTPPAAFWPHYQQFPIYPYPVPMQPIAPPPPHQSHAAHQRGWVPSPAPLALPAPQQAPVPQPSAPYLLPPGNSGSVGGAPSFRGSSPRTSLTVQHHRHSHPPRRFPGQRQDYTHGAQANRFDSSRGSPDRIMRLLNKMERYREEGAVA
ncbi:hypothetical protein WOLCODRAFT_160525 [Wolfiporia cocos MD-104 SS10]|uniref:RRM domain-containing protein n=1 Tax=Wolfiporia cocos (strain MD-104) TaxID=742152 RepID=A0A2H3J5H7_WOLCO|nr:hypothetical protein WOLCODRAFT_160525 [Wolfiporia cocos MD-104 SS10]